MSVCVGKMNVGDTGMREREWYGEENPREVPTNHENGCFQTLRDAAGLFVWCVCVCVCVLWRVHFSLLFKNLV